MSWMPNWKRPLDSFHLVLGYGDPGPPPPAYPIDPAPPQITSPDPKVPPPLPPDRAEGCKIRVQTDWSAGEDEETVALRLQSQLVVTLPPPHDAVEVKFRVTEALPQGVSFREWQERAGSGAAREDEGGVKVQMQVQKFREPLRVVSLSRTPQGGGGGSDGLGIFTRVIYPDSLDKVPHISVGEELLGYAHNWMSISVISLAGCGLPSVPPELMRLPQLEELYLEHNKCTTLPADMGQLKHLKILRADHNLLVYVPIELRQCEKLVELSLEHNRLNKPHMDIRSLKHLRVLRLFGNPLEFFPAIQSCTNLRHLSLANVRIDGNEDMTKVEVAIAAESSSYFVSKHKLSAFLSLVLKFSAVNHPLLASALAKILEDPENRTAIGRDESAIGQMLSMVLSDEQHVVEQACAAMASLANDPAVVMRLAKSDVLEAIVAVMRSRQTEILVSVLGLVKTLSFSSDAVSEKLLSEDTCLLLEGLCCHDHVSVQREALMALGSLAFCWENRRRLVARAGLKEMLVRLGSGSSGGGGVGVGAALSVRRAAVRVLAILGENESLRCAVGGHSLGRRGVRILSMDGGGMRGMATVQMLRQLERGTGKKIHELFDLICGTSTGGMLAVALAIKRFSLDQCEEIYKTLGKLVFVNVEPAESSTWREKLDQIYKSSSQNLRVMVHGSKHNAEEFERLLQNMCADTEGDLLIDSASRGGPKVFTVSTLVSILPASPFVFRNYQYPPGTPEVPLWTSEGLMQTAGTPAPASTLESQVGPRKAAYVGSCKFRLWEAIRASSAAPYYLDDYANGENRWQDGAIVANNPSVLAIREARLLWPDKPIDCIVSLGCGLLPPKVRGKGGWRLADTGAVLVESACSVERAEEALDTFLPFLPDLKYYRLNPIDERCDMELDETDPAQWRKLASATTDYIANSKDTFHELCAYLLPEEEPSSNPETEGRGEEEEEGKDCSAPEEVPLGVGPVLWFRRWVLLAEGGSKGGGEGKRHTTALLTRCHARGIRVQRHVTDAPTLPPRPTPVPPPPPPPAPSSPTSAPVSPRRQPWATPDSKVRSSAEKSLTASPSAGDPRGAPEVVGLGGPWAGPLSIPAAALVGHLEQSPHFGVVHMAMECDEVGFILSWRNDNLAIAVPGDAADAFLEAAKESIRERLRGNDDPPHSGVEFTSLADLVHHFPSFTLSRATHRFLGSHSVVGGDGTEVGAYLFKRALPDNHISADDARWMVGAWRDRVVVCSGRFAPPRALLSAVLDAGAKAIICPVREAPPPPSKKREGSREGGEGNGGEEGVGEGGEGVGEDGVEEEEEDLAEFLGEIYEGLFSGERDAVAALQFALQKHPRQHYKCHTPSR